MSEETELLDVDRAAARLGVSTLRIRQMILEGRLEGVRDNHGRLRLRAPIEVRPRPARPPEHKQELAVELLIDEIMELRQELADKQQAFERMTAVAERQQQALDKALTQLEEARKVATETVPALAAQRDRAAAAAARAMDMIEKSPAAPARMAETTSLLDRVLRLLSRRERN